MLVMMGDQIRISVGDLFMGAVFPGLLLGALYTTYILGLSWISPESAPAPEDAEPVSWAIVKNVLRSAIPPAALIIAVLGSIFFGIATPTEASGVGALGATLLALARGRLSLKGLHGVVQQATKTTAYIFALFVGATAFSLVLRGFGGDELIEGVLIGLPFGKDGVVVVLIAAFFLGFFPDWIEITLIILPLIAPVVSDLGVDLVWFTVMFAVCLQTSFITPPVGFALFYMKGVAPRGVDIRMVYRGSHSVRRSSDDRGHGRLLSPEARHLAAAGGLRQLIGPTANSTPGRYAAQSLPVRNPPDFNPDCDIPGESNGRQRLERSHPGALSSAASRRNAPVTASVTASD